MLLSSLAARAGSWVFTGSGDARYTVSPAYGGGTYVTQTWNPPGPSTGSFSSGGVGGTTDYSTSLVAKIQVTVTATWTYGSGQDNTSDPAPPSVWLCESSASDWDAPNWNGPNNLTGSGKADDGVGPVGTDYKLDASGYSGAASTSNAPASVPPAYWKKYPVTGNTVVLPTRTIRGEADCSGPYGGYLVAHAGSYSVTIHATPYNLRNTNFPGGLTGIQGDPGDLFWHYSWNSTDGNLAHLAGETVRENVACTVQTEIPPFGWQPPALFDVAVHAENGVCTDDNSYGAHQGDTPSQSFVKPYKKSSFSLTQTWKYLDPAISPSEQDLPQNPGPSTITDSVYPDSSSPSGYSFMVTKDGTPSPPLQLP